MKKASPVFCLVALAIVAAFAYGEDGTANKDARKQFLYQWTDNAGNIHITDSFGKVPDQYREKARAVEMPKRKQPPNPAAPESNNSGPEDRPADTETGTKAEWQQRMRDWKKRLDDAEQQYQQLDQERNELLRPWGTAALAPIESRLKAEQLEQLMKEAQAEINTARNMIDNVIPEEARKAGVPPGWLRE